MITKIRKIFFKIKKSFSDKKKTEKMSISKFLKKLSISKLTLPDKSCETQQELLVENNLLDNDRATTAVFNLLTIF